MADDAAQFVLLVKAVGMSSTAEKSVEERFRQALLNLTELTGAAFTQQYAAQGQCDFIVLMEIVATTCIGRMVQNGAPELDGVAATAQQIAVSVAAKLSQEANVKTETIPVESLGDNTFADVFHSCTVNVHSCTPPPK